jgi:TolB-like protein/Tfp pilus assembly protein PilF
MTFLAELRKRKVFQVAIGYLAVAWLLVQVTATILPAFDLPVWALRFVVLLFALGFPIAVLMAWALELTPEGVKLDVATPGGKRMLATAAVLMAGALGWFFRGHVAPVRPVAQAVAASAAPAPAKGNAKVDERSIAVLPLVNASNDPEQQFFSDGLSENLIDTLSRFNGLKVIGRTSAFQFRDGKEDSATIGRKLGVAYLLSGSVQRAVGVVRISASLVKAADGSTLWAQHYDRPYKDLFALQDEIAQAVADALQVQLLSPGAATKQDNRPPSGNLDAYAAYLHGMQFFYQGDSRQMIKYMALATRLDPGYAAAWDYLSVAWTRLGNQEAGAQAQADYREARTATDKALALAPGIGLTHAVRGNLLLSADFDWQGALAEFRRGVELAPEVGAIHSGYSRTLAANGKVREAIAQKQFALSIDPRMVGERFRYADLLIAMGRLDEAGKEVDAAVELSGWTQPRHDYRVRFALLRGDARAALEAAGQTDPEVRDLALAFAAQIGPDRAAADAALAKFLRDHADWGERRPYDLASLHALRGDVDGTVEWLDRTWARRDVDILQVMYDPAMLQFRNDAAFIAFCRKIGLPPPGESEALGIDRIRAMASSAQARS